MDDDFFVNGWRCGIGRMAGWMDDETKTKIICDNKFESYTTTIVKNWFVPCFKEESGPFGDYKIIIKK